MAAWPPAPVIDSDNIQSLVNVALWVRAVERIHEDLKACPQIEWSDAPSPAPDAGV